MTAYPYAVVVFASRETVERTLRTVTDCAAAAVPGSSVELLINGNPALSAGVKERFAKLPVPANGRLRLWEIEFADKANALNQFVHHVWRDEEVVWFVDGYVSPEAQALHSMHATLQADSQLLAVTAMPSMGRSAERIKQEMAREGGLHGNLSCVRGQALRRFVNEGIWLPLGTYWVDGLLGSLLHFNLDPSRFERDLRLIQADPQATWKIDPVSRLSAKAFSWFRRLQRQSKGKIENAALSDFLHRQRKAPSDLPTTINHLVQGWAKADPLALLRALQINPIRWLALRELLRRDAPNQYSTAAEMISESTVSPSEDGRRPSTPSTTGSLGTVGGGTPSRTFSTSQG